MVLGRLFSVGLCLLLAACSSDGSGEASSSGSGGEGGGPPAPALDPALFDCSAASNPPDRVTTVPVSCATDRACKTPLVAGHRSAGGDLGVLAPENTLAAVRAAVALGVDFIETDPRETKDGILVNMHDSTVDRTTLGAGEVAQMTLAELQALTLKPRDLQGDFSCERVPTIEEVLLLSKGRVHVLLDANKTSRVDLLVEAVQKTGTIEWAIFDTDDVAKIDEALALEPSLLTHIRVSSQAELDEELAHFAAHPPVIIEVNEGAAAADLAPSIHAAGHRVFNNVFITDFAAAVTSDISLYEPVFASGVDIAQTDRPDLVLRSLGR
ncbi:MAG: glycerophosphodiester phosphodiesterase family protein [Polyangiaceae bacterium]|nr:glycerophosphodiester phosphodiesterase family protein [Polyangiaceae bacterium]